MLSIRKTVFVAVSGSSFAVALLFMQAAAAAETLEIHYTGLDITYDGSTISNVGNPDPLQSVDFLLDGSLELGLNAPGDSPLDIDLYVPGVSNLPVGGGAVTSSSGGSLYLRFPDSDYLNLELGAAEVVYVDFSTVQLYFVLAAGSAEVLGQSLPIDYEFSGEVAVSFSTQINSKSDDGNYLTGFTANGTGEVEGVPEPGSLTLLLCGLISLVLLRRRR